jgi:large subunit ribosomal protein L4
MSLKIKVYNKSAEPVKELDLTAKVFGVKANSELLHQAMIAQRANERQVLAHTKDRSEVSGGGKKPWKQKGTGRARSGSSRSPIWIGGGVTFGPTKDRNFKVKINQKMKQKAIFMALSDKVNSSVMVVLDTMEFSEYKTKEFNKLLDNLEKKVLSTDRRNILIINEAKDEKTKFSARNLKGVKVINVENLNLIDLLNFKNLLVTENIISILEKRYVK